MTRHFALVGMSALLLGGLIPLDAATTPTQPVIAATPIALSFTYEIGSALPGALSVKTKLSGSKTQLTYTVTVPAGKDWLIVTPLTGTTGGSISVRVNPTSLVADVYTATLQIDAPGTSGPATVNVTLTVKYPPPVLSAVPTAPLSLTWATDQTAPSPIPINVSTDGQPASFTVTASAPWLSVDTNIGITMMGSPVKVTATILTDGLVPGTYNGKITVASPNAKNKSVPLTVSLTVTPGKATIDGGIWPNAAPIGSDDTTITLRGHHFFKTSVVNVNSTPLSGTVWVSTTVMLATIPKSMLADQGQLDVTVTNDPQPASTPVKFTVTPPGPVIQIVVNGGSYRVPTGNTTIAPGEIIAIFGSGLGPTGGIAQDASGGFFDTTLGTPAALVEFELSTGVWTPAPIIMASPNQINAVAPFAMPTGSPLNLRVTYNSLASDPFPFDAVDADPGIFTTDSSGRGQGAILNYDTTSKKYAGFNSSSNPALRGSIISMYITGAGTQTPGPTKDGELVPLPPAALPVVDGVVTVSIAGTGAVVESKTAVPGCVAGLVQLNVTIPTSLKAGKNLPIVVTVAGAASPATATISVK